MADVVKPAVRSAMMSAIRGKDTRPELVLRRGLFGRGVRFRLHAPTLPGRPDIVIRKRNAAILVHGCFWHAHHGCRFFRVPEGNRQFWVEKLGRNRDRDARAVERLQAAGWRVAVVWECALRTDSEAVLDAVYGFLMGDDRYIEIAGDTSGGQLELQSQVVTERKN
jgi:DNA mismatch endonuclease (patch repair protein)